MRGAYCRWLFFGAGPVEAAVTNESLGVVVPVERRGTTGYGSLADVRSEACSETLVEQFGQMI